MITATLREERLIRRFELLDINGDGDVTWDDFELLLRRLAALYGEPSDGAPAQRLRKALRGWWGMLATVSDIDSDNQITQDEFVTAFRDRIHGRDGFDKTLKPVVEAILAMAGTAVPDRFTLDEYVAFMRAFGVGEQDAADAFRRLTAELGTGHLTSAAFLDSSLRFYTGESSDDPAADLFGHPGR